MAAHITKKEKAKQGHRTPVEFLHAIEKRYGSIGFDLAATPGHAVCPKFFSPKDDSLSQDWQKIRIRRGQVIYLNPPFAHLRPWARKLEEECRFLSHWTLCLVPYSGGSHWWNDHALNKCLIAGIPRMTFRGSSTPFPKDLALLCFGFGAQGSTFWNWRDET